MSMPSVPRVVVVGGGFAALEAILALRALAGGRIGIELVSLHESFAYRPTATAEPFAGVPRLEYDLREIARDLEVAFRVDRLEAVAPQARRLRLASGARLDYDFLVLAVGAQLHTSVAGALMFTGPRDEPYIARLREDLLDGDVDDIVFAVPAGVCWPLPVYELALLTAGFARRHGRPDARIAVVTPERAPLELFGDRGSDAVRAVLDERGVRFLGGRTPERFDRAGRLTLAGGAGVVGADRVVAVPVLAGREIAGVPRDHRGFTPVDPRGRVAGIAHVYAAGDMTDAPLKHGGLATQQADGIAADIVARIGLAAPAPPARTLDVRLVGGAEPLEVHADLDIRGRAVDARVVAGAPGAADTVPGPDKVLGRHLTPFLQRRDALRA